MGIETITNSNLGKISDLLANLTGVPFRIYRGTELVSTHNYISLLADPFDTCRDRLEGVKHGIDWIYGDNYYYGVVSCNDTHVVIGPVGENMSSAGDNALQISEKLNISEDVLERFLHQMAAIRQMSAYKLSNILMLVNLLVNGEMVELDDLKLRNFKPVDLLFEESSEESRIQHNLFPLLEQTSMTPGEMIAEYLVEKGMPQRLESYTNDSPLFEYNPNFTESEIENARISFRYVAYRMMSTMSRAGIDYSKADALRRQYNMRCQNLETVEEINKLKKEMLLDFAKRRSQNNDFFRYSKMVIEAMDFINSNLTRFIDTSDVADYLFVSRSRLSTVFKHDTGIFLSDYIQLQKLELAKKMLSSSNYSIADIANHLAYKSQSHFTSVFKRFTDMTPSEYRKRNWAEQHS